MTKQIFGQNRRLRIIPILMMIYSALIPLENILTVSEGVSVNRYIGVLIMACIILWFFKERKTTIKLPVWMVLFSVFALCTMLWSINKNISVLSVMLNVVLFTVLAIQYPLTDAEKTGILVAIFVGGVVVSLLMLSGGAYTVINIIDRDRMTFAVGGLSVDNNNLSTSLSLCCIAGVSLIYKKNRSVPVNIAGIIGLAVIAIAILMTGSRGGLLTLIAGGLIFLLFSDSGIKPRTLIVGAICVYAAVYFIQNFMSESLASRFTIQEVIESGGTGRTTIWIDALKIFSDSSVSRWLFGYGFGSFPDIMTNYIGLGKAAHNDIIQMLLETGLVGLFLYFKMWWEMARVAFRKRNAMVLALLTVVAVGSLSMEMLIKKMLWLAFYIAIIYISESKKDSFVQNK